MNEMKEKVETFEQRPLWVKYHAIVQAEEADAQKKLVQDILKDAAYNYRSYWPTTAIWLYDDLFVIEGENGFKGDSDLRKYPSMWTVFHKRVFRDEIRWYRESEVYMTKSEALVASVCYHEQISKILIEIAGDKMKLKQIEG